MPELLLELFSEEIPARMQVQAAKDLERIIVGALTNNGLLFEAARAFVGPRRLMLAIAGLPAKQPDVKEEKKGPRLAAPQAAIDGFLKSTGLTLAQCEKRSDPKGDYYLAVIDRKGRPTGDVLKTLLPEAIAKLPWPKSMRWPGAGHLRWVRPLHGIIATLDGEVVPFELAGVKSGNTTWGHRFLSSGAIKVKRFDDYKEQLRKAHVVVDGAERRETILEDAKENAFALGLEVVEDEGLANEVMGLAEWPVVLVGAIDQRFMDLPPEILQTTMRANQKYFALRDPGTLKLANKFVLVANMVAKDGGKEIVAGNERVLRARLADAKFFWDQDRKRTLDSRRKDLDGIVFHAKLGTQLERVKRIEALAAEIAKTIGLKEKDIEKVKRAALLCKADLTTGVVGEFPELQGIMGRYYALADGEDKDVADAIRNHYRPLGPSDSVPTEQISICVALADKLDTLIGFFAIDETPTGSGDPYALRRAALGLIRTLISNSVRLPLTNLIGRHAQGVLKGANPIARKVERVSNHRAEPGESDISYRLRQQASVAASNEKTDDQSIVLGLLEFLTTRLSVALSSEGSRIECVRAVFHNNYRLSEEELLAGQAIYQSDDMVWLAAVTRALQAFLKTDDGANLLTGYKRAANILKIEEKKGNHKYLVVDQTAFVQDEEKKLSQAFITAKVAAGKALHDEDFGAAMAALAKLRAPIDRFFEKVTVNVEDKKLRANRLGLLNALVETAHQVADFSKIEG